MRPWILVSILRQEPLEVQGTFCYSKPLEVDAQMLNTLMHIENIVQLKLPDESDCDAYKMFL
jgi:hypothetical protein